VGHDGTGCDDGVGADGHSGQDGGRRSDPHTFLSMVIGSTVM
jgi:hypothetical protein